MIYVKRVYEKAEKRDGYRVLVDRLWPRGISKGKAKIGLWLKDIAPSDELRLWFSHDPRKWPVFKKKYFKELKPKKDLAKVILDKAGKRDVTLLFAAKEESFNNAVALKEYLKNNSRSIGRAK